MKSLKLNKKNKELLLEMCKMLFKEYNFIYLFDKTCNDDLSEEHNEEFIIMTTYKVNDLAFKPGYNRKLYEKIIEESKAKFKSTNDKGWTWWHPEVVNKYAKEFDIPDKKIIFIYWYEFIILHLPKRLFKELVSKNIKDKEEYHDWLYDDMSYLENPINHFYSEFKKLR